MIAFITFFFFLIVISFFVIYPGTKNEMGYFLDAKLRNELAGKIDFLMIGASHGLTAFVPQVIDKELGVNSYNISSPMMTTSSKYFLLNKELKRNPVKTVVLEVSFDSLSRNEKKENAIGDANTVHRADSFQEALMYLFKNVGFHDWLNVYARIFMHGLSNTKDLLRHNKKNKIHYEDKGSHLLETIDISLSEKQCRKLAKTIKIKNIYNSATFKRFCKIVDLCKQNNLHIIIVVVPISDNLICKIDDLDSFRVFLSDYCKEAKIEYYDFNLIKSRYSLFNDASSHHDLDHMSRSGAEIFSRLFSETLTKASQGESTDSLFYKSYAEMEKDSPYSK